MKIATYNIDWAKNNKIQIEKYLNAFDFDFLILTEAIELNLKNYDYIYFSNPINGNEIYENQNYQQILNGKNGYRTIIYSKIPMKSKFSVNDSKTSLALEFTTEFGDLAFYATIIGTQFRIKPFAKIELENCISDCKKIFKENKNLFIIGDLNTSFLENEKRDAINKETTNELRTLITNLNLFNCTENIIRNIDHIIIPKSLKKTLIDNEIFVERDKFSDHQGVYITLNSHFC